MKKLLIAVSTLILTSCVNQMDRLSDAQKKYPKCIVTPPTALLSNFDAMVEDTTNNQIFVISYYVGSTTKVYDVRNIK